MGTTNRYKSVIAATACAVFLLSATLLYGRNCYSTWLNAWESATATYNNDLDRCSGSSGWIYFSFSANGDCKWEADTNYDRAIDSAASSYEACLNQK